MKDDLLISSFGHHLSDWDDIERRKETITRTELLNFIARNEEAHEEHRTAHSEQSKKLDKLDSTIEDVQDTVRAVTTKLDTLDANTTELIEVFKTLQSLVKFIMWVGKIAKPLIMTATFITAVTLWLKGVKFP